MRPDIRGYEDKDYEKIKALYRDSSLYGGQFDEARDARPLMLKRVSSDPDAILVAEINGMVVGTISIMEDGRMALLFRFAVQKGSLEVEIAKMLLTAATASLQAKGHTQVLVYTPLEGEQLHERYRQLGLHRGNNYTCYWMHL